MDKGKKKSRKNKKKNKEAIEFILANRDAEDPNFNNPDVNKKILLQVNKDEDLTEEQKKIIESIPKVQRGIFDEKAQLKLMAQDIDNNDDKNKIENNDNNKEKKGVNFDFDKNEIINYDKKKTLGELQHEKLINDIKNKKIDISKIEDEETVKEIFKNLKVNAKIVEYNDLGLKKDTDPELLKLVTDKEFIEGVDIFVPAPKDNDGKIIEEYDNDMNEENMNEEYKELEKELKSDDEEDKKIKKEEEKNGAKEKKEEEISTSSKTENLTENQNIELKGDLEDDFVLLANGGELPVELITDQEKENLEKNNNKINTNDIKHNKEFNNFDTSNKNTYKYITKEEIEYVQKKFLMDENDENVSGKKKGNFIGKKEFNDAINEILNSKKGKNDKNKVETVMGLKKSILDEEEFEEYELSEEDEELLNNNTNKEKEKEKNNANKNLDDKKLKNVISNKKEENFDDEEEEEEEEEKEEDFQPNIKIEYVSREDEPAPFDKEDKIKKKRKNKKEFKKSRTKQYQQMKENGELSDESFDKEKLDELLHDEELVKKTNELFETNIDEEKNIKEVDKEIETKYNLEPKVQRDITQTSDKIVNLPKTIKQEKKEKNFSKKSKTEEEGNKEEDKEENKINNNNFDDKDRKKETKEDKALRKKLLKMERKERRAEKKKLKNAFKEEKVSQQRQIAQANKIVRYGLSVKDI